MKTLLLTLFPFFGFSQPAQYTNLALEGGGTRGVAYAGAFKVLEEKGILQNIEKVAGSSAGAIVGMMLAIGYNAKDIDSILMSLPFQKFNDGRGGLYGKYKRVKKQFGVYKGDHYEKWLGEMLHSKTGNANMSFRDLHEMKIKDPRYRDFYCTATNISRQRLEVFSYETSPDLSLAVAVRISGGIPLYFTPVALDDSLHKIKKGDTPAYINYYVDGGTLCNYPISMFDSCKTGGHPLLCDAPVFNPQTLGIKLEREEQIALFRKDSVDIAPFRPKNISDFLSAFGNLTTETMNRKYPGLEDEKGRTIYISYGNSDARIKKMSVAKKRMLYDNGVKGTLEFLEKAHP